MQSLNNLNVLRVWDISEVWWKSFHLEISILFRSPTDKQVLLLDTVHKMFRSEELLSNAARQAFVDRSLLTLLWHCSLDALRVFFGNIIVEAMDTLNSRFTKVWILFFFFLGLGKSKCWCWYVHFAELWMTHWKKLFDF